MLSSNYIAVTHALSMHTNMHYTPSTTHSVHYLPQLFYAHKNTRQSWQNGQDIGMVKVLQSILVPSLPVLVFIQKTICDFLLYKLWDAGSCSRGLASSDYLLLVSSPDLGTRLIYYRKPESWQCSCMGNPQGEPQCARMHRVVAAWPYKKSSCKLETRCLELFYASLRELVI